MMILEKTQKYENLERRRYAAKKRNFCHFTVRCSLRFPRMGGNGDADNHDLKSQNG